MNKFVIGVTPILCVAVEKYLARDSRWTVVGCRAIKFALVDARQESLSSEKANNLRGVIFGLGPESVFGPVVFSAATFEWRCL